MIDVIHYYFLRGKTITAEKYYIKIERKYKNLRVK